ncbi:MAG TPA: Gfo/Idh/MocA family oxidoreductase [Planctomycetota bacterium]|nr:Gfo/Idh/MocA family oxidoreductase [Planctomycetota bacterium]
MSLSSRPNAVSAGDKPVLNVAMVGHAFMGRAHGNAYRQVNHFFDLPFRVVPAVVVGRDAARAAAAARKLGFAAATADLRSVLADPDIHLVDVATPNDSHHSITMQALRANKHVLCEKPLALTLAQAREMAALARKQKVRVGLWHNYRRAPATALAATMIARGDLGTVRQVRAVYLQDWLSDPSVPASWRTSRKTCGSGAHGDLNAHLIDLTRALTGLEFEAVSGVQQTFTKQRPDGSGGTAKVDVDDAFCFLARFKGGAIGTYEATRTAPGRKNFNCIEVSGTKGSLRWNLERMNELEVFSFADARDGQGFRSIMCMDSVHPYAANWWPDGHIVGYEHTFVHHVADFVHALQTDEPFAPDFADGVAVQAVLEAALQSAKMGAWVKVAR